MDKRHPALSVEGVGVGVGEEEGDTGIPIPTSNDSYSVTGCKGVKHPDLLVPGSCHHHLSLLDLIMFCLDGDDIVLCIYNYLSNQNSIYFYPNWHQARPWPVGNIYIDCDLSLVAHWPFVWVSQDSVLQFFATTCKKGFALFSAL